jgi:aspartate ammonia-lyase
METTRIEKDSLGSRELPTAALYGINTLRAIENFPIAGRTAGQVPELVWAMAVVKLAAARANQEIGALAEDRAQAMCTACEEVRAGQHNQELLADMLEGSGGTSLNMNFNEVIGNRASVLLGGAPGAGALVNPNDDVNLSQSTNDVVPTALKLAVFRASESLAGSVLRLAEGFAEKKQQYAGLLRLGRTCLQDAQPMTLGQAFGGYEAVLRRHAEHLAALRQDLLLLPLGGTAIGTGFGVRAGYKKAVYRHLSALVGTPVSPEPDPFDGMQNLDGCARLSAELRNTANTLWKIANDLIILSSGPAGGIGEITLPGVQAGSSIMPGKINPVIPMAVCQAALAITGNDAAIALGCQQGLLEINHFELLVCDRTLDSIALLTRASAVFLERCVRGLVGNEEQSWKNLLASSALATALVPALGYAKVSSIVRTALAERRPFLEAAIEQGLLRRDEIRSALLRAAVDPAGEGGTK